MDNSCKLCMEPITNPICTRCLDKQIKGWLGKTKDYFRIHELTKDFELFDCGNVKCVICSKTSVVCPYCFSNEAYKVLKDMNTKLENVFLDYFNLRLVEKTL